MAQFSECRLSYAGYTPSLHDQFLIVSYVGVGPKKYMLSSTGRELDMSGALRMARQGGPASAFLVSRQRKGMSMWWC